MLERVSAAVQWRDLVALSPLEILIELCLPLPWLLLALFAGAYGQTACVIAATFVMFMTGLRVTHNAFHRTLGLSSRAGDVVMFVLSVLLGGAMHAIEHTHLHHHRDCLAPPDVEGRIAAHGFWRALLHSPAYPLLIHVAAIRNGTRRQRRWIASELAAVVVLQSVIWSFIDSRTLQCMALSLLFANLSAAMVGIWAVHAGCDHGPHVARTSRSRWLDLLVVNMFHHLEHHRYPAVPTCHLPQLARRLDAHGWGDCEGPPRVSLRAIYADPSNWRRCH